VRFSVVSCGCESSLLGPDASVSPPFPIIRHQTKLLDEEAPLHLWESLLIPISMRSSFETSWIPANLLSNTKVDCFSHLTPLARDKAADAPAEISRVLRKVPVQRTYHPSLRYPNSLPNAS
jgi:hypothetical protein